MIKVILVVHLPLVTGWLNLSYHKLCHPAKGNNIKINIVSRYVC